MPEFSGGEIGESAGQTLMRAMDHIDAIEACRGGSIRRLIVMFEVDHPPDDDHPRGSSTIGHVNIAGMARSELVGLLELTADQVRYGDS